MAAHRVEQIMDAVYLKLKGLATTKQNVRLNPIYDLQDIDLPSIDVMQMGDVNNSSVGAVDKNLNEVYSELEVVLKIIVAKSDAYVKQINLIRKEMEIAMHADVTLGKSFVLMMLWQSASAPTLSVGDIPVASIDLLYKLTYKRSFIDPSV
jgi:hypothetical protein